VHPKHGVMPKPPMSWRDEELSTAEGQQAVVDSTLSAPPSTAIAPVSSSGPEKEVESVLPLPLPAAGSRTDRPTTLPTGTGGQVGRTRPAKDRNEPRKPPVSKCGKLLTTTTGPGGSNSSISLLCYFLLQCIGGK